jgi:hypothetical protein
MQKDYIVIKLASQAVDRSSNKCGKLGVMEERLI